VEAREAVGRMGRSIIKVKGGLLGRWKRKGNKNRGGKI
jgi:hypothetical protein